MRPRLPFIAFLTHFRNPALPVSRGAREIFVGLTGLIEDSAGLIGGLTGGGQVFLCGGEAGFILKRGLGRLQLFAGVLAFSGQTIDFGRQGGPALIVAGGFLPGAGGFRLGVPRGAFGIGGLLARLAFKFAGLCQGKAGFIYGIGRGRGFLVQSGGFLAGGFKAIALFQARSCGRRSVRARDISVPAPEIALPRDKALSGQKVFCQFTGALRIGNTDGVQPSGERGGRIDIFRKRLTASRQITGFLRLSAPMPWRFLVQRGFQIISQCGAERLFISGGCAHGIERAVVDMVLFQKAGEGGDFPFQRRGFRLKRAQRFKRRPFRRFALKARGLGGVACIAGRFHSGFSGFCGLDDGGQFALIAFAQQSKGLIGAIAFQIEAGDALLRLCPVARGGVAFGANGGKAVGRIVECGLLFLPPGIAFIPQCSGCFHGRGFTFGFGFKRGNAVPDAIDGGLGVLTDQAFTLDLGGQIGEALFQQLYVTFGIGGIPVERIALAFNAPQSRTGFSLRLTQRVEIGR